MTASIQAQKRADRSVIWVNLLSEPLFTLYNFIAFILYRDLGASPFEIALMTMLKPVVTILSFYWSSGISRRVERARLNLVSAGILMRLPFLLCPWFDSIGFLIGAAVNYMFFFRAGVPAWLEMLKRNGGGKRAFSTAAGFAYLEGVVLSLAMGALLDRDPTLWKGLFSIGALIGLVAVWIQARLPKGELPKPVSGEKETLREILKRPWKDTWRLMRENPEFSLFQWVFMVAGFGLMLIQPALPMFSVDQLHISYFEMAGAVSVAKGLGFALTSPLWARGMDRFSLMQVTSVVFAFFGLFPLLLGLSLWQVGWLYAAYFLYGSAQAGSHLVWNLSGPHFAGREESSRYTGVNVLMAGLRGGVAPPLGGWLAIAWGPLGVLCAGGLLCLASGGWIWVRITSRVAVEKAR